MTQESTPLENSITKPWYAEVTRYQWLVLLIASLGWVFDVFEGQIFVASMNEAMPDLLPPTATGGDKRFANNVTLGAFLLGGALGGVGFGVLSDRIGRKKVMSYTILMYSLFTCFSAFSTAWWHMAVFRFLVAMGVGGEWAVASAMVAEVVPVRARARLLGVFHASSVFGTLLAVAAGHFIVGQLKSEAYPSLPWRLGFIVGVLPAFLIIWIRRSVHEPENWERARESAMVDLSKKLGSFTELFGPTLVRNTLVGVGLAAVGLATFWGAHIYGKDILRRDVEKIYLGEIDETAGGTAAADAYGVVTMNYLEGGRAEESDIDQVTAKIPVNSQLSVLKTFGAPPAPEESELYRQFHQDVKKELLAPYFKSIKGWEMLGMLATTIGGGMGLLSFGPLCERIGRRATFLFFHLGGLASAFLLFQTLHGVYAVLAFLPVFGFLTLGMHAGYAIYFPELFPTRLRGTGGGFCFNVGRILAAPILFISGWLQLHPESRFLGLQGLGLSLEDAASILSVLFLLGVFLLWFAKETKGEELPE